jgi:hypothetical protein
MALWENLFRTEVGQLLRFSGEELKLSMKSKKEGFALKRFAVPTAQTLVLVGG